MKKLLTLVLLYCLTLELSFAQKKEVERLTATQCVAIALKNNLQLQQQALSKANADLNYNQARLSYLPNVNANWSFNRQFGATFDMFSFQRTTSRTDFSSPVINANLVLFRGLARYYNLQRTIFEREAVKAGLDKIANEIITNVLALYLQLLFDESNLNISNQRLELLKKQKERIDKRFEAGLSTHADVLNLKAQVASEQVTNINLQNQLERDKMQFLQLLQLDVETPIILEKPNIGGIKSFEDPLPTLKEVESYALSHMPEIKEQANRVAAANYQMQAARAQLYPQISLSGGLGANYTSNGGQPVYEQRMITIGNFQFPQNVLVGRTRQDYFSQIEDNFSKSFGLTVNIPIFNGFQATTTWRASQLNIKSANLTYKITSDNLVRTLQRAYLDCKNARSRYDAVEEQLEALREALNVAETRFNNGALDFYTYFETLTTKTRVEQELVQAQYDYFFKRKILDVYLGKPLSF